ncbi:unnamed protein product, partial [Rotaria sp. Silwood2]
KQCNLCGQIFCSKCIQKTTNFIQLNSLRSCTTCLLITNERTTYDQLASIRIKYLRAYLIHSKTVSLNRVETCFEKQDLINLILSVKNQIPEENYVFVERPTTINIQTSNDNTTAINIDNNQPIQQSTINTDEHISSLNVNSTLPTNESETEIPIETTLSSNVDSSSSTNESEMKNPIECSPSKINSNRITLNDVSSLQSINDLTIRQLKDILKQNFVSTTGCVEKKELINKVELLFRDHQQQKESNINIANEQSDENLCKICMDANIDCVFLDCGHLCTCVRCGKQLSECPLCRSYIIRVVRVFKS